MARPQDLSMPLVRGDGISRADNFQLGPVPALGRETPGPHTKRGCWKRFPLLAFGKFCQCPILCLLLYHKPMFSCFMGDGDQPEKLRIKGDGPGSLLLPTYPLPFGSLRLPSPNPLWPCQLQVTLCGPVTPFGGLECMESGLGSVPSSATR